MLHFAGNLDFEKQAGRLRWPVEYFNRGQRELEDGRITRRSNSLIPVFLINNDELFFLNFFVH